jgi:uncharacterized MnhB-related membrane protein
MDSPSLVNFRVQGIVISLDYLFLSQPDILSELVVGFCLFLQFVLFFLEGFPLSIKL